MAFAYNALIPEFMVRDLQQSKDFYIHLCGFQLVYAREEERFVFLSFGGSQLMLEELPRDSGAGVLGAGVNVSVDCDDIDALYQKLLDARYPVAQALAVRAFRVGEGCVYSREFAVKDPDGYYLRFVQSAS